MHDPKIPPSTRAYAASQLLARSEKAHQPLPNSFEEAEALGLDELQRQARALFIALPEAVQAELKQRGVRP